MPLQQTTFKNIVTKGEFALNEQFLLLSQCFQIYSIIYTFTYRDFTHFYIDVVVDVVCFEMVLCWKGLTSIIQSAENVQRSKLAVGSSKFST